ncbi:MAG: hypothetical protein ACFB2Z_06155 [Maricaulaceae bacterium]
MLSLAVCTAGLAHAGAWPLEPGVGQVIVTTLMSRADVAFDEDGARTEPTDFFKAERGVFAEFGLTPRLTLIGQTSLQIVQIQDLSGFTDTGFGNGASEFGAGYLLAGRGGGVAAVQGAAIVPGRVENVIDSPLGQGVLDGEARALFGRGVSLFGRHGFVDLQGAYRFRSGAPPDEARFDATLGADVHPRLQVLAQGFLLASVTEPGPGRREVFSFKGQLGAVLRLSQTYHVQVGVGRTLSGRNVVAETATLLSVWRRF